jgi:DNA polymerase III subunit epsilon
VTIWRGMTAWRNRLARWWQARWRVRGAGGQRASGRGLGRQELGRQGLGRQGLDGLELSDLGLRLVGLGLGERALADTDFVVVDLETTGWTPDEARITEIGAVRFTGGQVTGEFSTLINPGQPIPPDIAELTGISDAMVARAPGIAAVLPGFLAFAGSSVLTAHNAPFDLSFLIAACGDCGLRWPGFSVLDTVTLARQVLGETEVPDCKLSTLARYFGAPTPPCHRALADARATAAVLHGLIGRLAESGVRTLAELSG